MIRRILPAATAAALLAMAAPAAAYTVTVTTDGDNFVTRTAGAENHGTSANLRVRNDVSLEHETYIEFPSPGVPAGSTGVSAVLRVFAHEEADKTVRAHATGDFGELTLSWSNKPALGPVASSQAVTTTGWKEFPVPVAGQGRNAYALTTTSTNAVNSAFSSREHTNGNDPQLVVTFTPPSTWTPPPLPPPPPPPPPSSCTGQTWHSFENGIVQGPLFNGTFANPGRITNPLFAAPIPTMDGQRSGRFEVRDGDSPIPSGERSELRSPNYLFTNGQEYWIRQRTLLTSQGFTQASWRMVRQWHDASSSGSPDIAMFIIRDPLRFRIGHGDSSRTDWISAALNRNQWYDVTVHWRNGEGGFLEVYFAPAGQTPAIQQLQGGTLTNGGTRKTGMSLPIGKYHTGAYRSASLSETDVLHHDAICWGTSRAQVGL
jgi:Polysaccharide lyase